MLKDASNSNRGSSGNSAFDMSKLVSAASHMAPTTAAAKQPSHGASTHSSTADLTLSLDHETFTAHLMQSHQNICQHLYHKGFLTGQLSDVTVRAFDQSYHLHRLLLVRSPFFERLFSSSAASMSPIIDLVIDDDNVTQEALSIAIAYLYGAPIYSHIKSNNVHNVLACATMLQLDDLAEMCSAFIVKTIDGDNVLASIGFVSCGVAYGRHGDDIEQACVRFLCHTLANKYSVDSAVQREMVQLFSMLPFALLKSLLESELTLSTEFEKFQFARQVIDKRKTMRTIPALPFCPASMEAKAGQENVVLLFDRDAKGRISVIDHASKKSKLQNASLRSAESATRRA